MTEEGTERVSLEKPAATGATGATAPPERPKQVAWVVAAMLASGLLGLLASLSLYGLHSFILHQVTVANGKLKRADRRTPAELAQAAHQQPTAAVFASAIFLVVLVLVARAVWRGRYWSRWAIIGVWILASFTGTVFGGALQVLYIVQSAPLALKVPVTLSSITLTFAVAVVAFVKPVPAWLNLTRPDRSTSAASARRGGLLSQRDPVRSARQGLSTASPVGSRKVRETAARTEDLFRGDANTERARAKQRANTEAMQRGAAEARARARGSKSRRNGS